ncbi:MAG TPA: hypothetical protein VF757_11270 [Sphingomicrobium sp.]
MMIAAALLLSTAGAPLTDDADAANLAYTQCLFATSRASNEARLPVSAFAQKLATLCLPEQHALERTSARIFERRGEPHPALKAHALAEAAREQVIDSYRRTLELEPQLKRIAELCRAHPEQCRQ